MVRLTTEQATELRNLVSSRYESGEFFKRGEQSRLAEEYGIARQRVQQMVRKEEERQRLKNPIKWEIRAAEKRGEKPNVLQLWYQLKYVEKHPTFWQDQDPKE